MDGVLADADPAAAMGRFLEETPGDFVLHVFRPMVCFVLQLPMESNLVDVLKEFMDGAALGRRGSLVRIAMEELGNVMALRTGDDTGILAAINTYLDIFPLTENDTACLANLMLNIKLSKSYKRKLLQLVAQSALYDDAKRDFFLVVMQNSHLSGIREQAIKFLDDLDIVNPIPLQALAHQLRDKSKRVQRLVFSTLLAVEPSLSLLHIAHLIVKMLIAHLSASTLAPTIGLLCLISADSPADRDKLRHLLVIYCTWPQHSLEAACTKLLALDPYSSPTLQALVREAIAALV
ncbi:hypothetical protein ACHHYP_07404 [Achlya hypogyna]|uniref:Symplekin C-terminal domain-containing protein n=1 Tax=Achlya hypogyna TaxID=1202772 RepID=A0A1V9ZM51_ACHHY|nr:hypothetical protein ACHHYP_07404 [Achlya hypogyna]